MLSADASVDPPAPSPGRRIGNYELVRRLAKGGMGEVYLARDLTLGRRVAVKFLATDADEVVARRFVIEARATARCTHENIVVIHEVASWEGLPYMVLEYLDGEPLGAQMLRGALPTGRVLEVVRSVLRALARAHQAAIIHRDLKPENIFITRRGVVKVLDFGIAKLVDTRDEDDAIRRDRATLDSLDHGRIVGTRPFMAPEQWARAAVDARTDLFALGVIAYCALAGRHPSGSAQPQAFEAAGREVDRPYPSLALAAPHVPEAVVAIVDRAIQKRPEHRYQSASDFLRGLDELDRHGARRIAGDACPYPGLAGFTEADADRYFGRAPELRRAMEILRTRSVLAVVGPSGAGKSSFVQAGVVARLRADDDGWDVVVVRPGPRPLHGLVGALRRLPGLALPADAVEVLTAEPGRLGEWLRSWCHGRARRVALAVDQFEELFARGGPAPERDAYLTALLSATDEVLEPVRLVLAIRSDFLGAVAAYPAFADAIVEGTQLLSPLDRGGLRAALEGPLEQVGYRFEDPAALDEIVDAFAGEDHALPVLQAVAVQLWERRDQRARVVGRDAIAAVGGVAGALARYANAVIAPLPESHREIAHQIFLRLVTVHGVRTATDRAAIEAIAPEAPRVLRALLAARLVVANDEASTVELVHEVLIESWPLLADWLRSSREDRLVRERIAHAAAAWDERGRPPGLLWSGDAVLEARRFVERAEIELSVTEVAFVRASLAWRSRTARRRRGAIAAALLIALAVAAASVVALVKVRRAERAASAEAESATRARRELVEQVRALEAAEQARAAAHEEAAGRRREVESQRAQVELGEAALRDALAEARSILRQRDAALAKERVLRDDLEAALARERERNAELTRRRARIVQELPP